MKTISLSTLKWVFLLICMPLLTACSWEELPSYEEAEISAVQLYHRWASTDKDPITGEPVVKEKRLNCESAVDSENGVINVKVTVPEASGDFSEDVRNQVTQSKLWGQVTVSTAARITPIDGTAALGTPDDWTKDKKFSVKAANGTTKIWTIKVVSFSR